MKSPPAAEAPSNAESSPQRDHPAKVIVTNPFWQDRNNLVRFRTAEHWIAQGRAEWVPGYCDRIRMTPKDQRIRTAEGYDSIPGEFALKRGQSGTGARGGKSDGGKTAATIWVRSDGARAGIGRLSPQPARAPSGRSGHVRTVPVPQRP